MNRKNIHLTIALTGNRLSGKDSVGKLFAKIGIPVFDADAILKFLINYNPSVPEAVKRCFGDSYVMGDYINPMLFDTDEKMSRLISIVEYPLFDAYSKFREKYKSYNHYTIFNSSVIFEKRWYDKFDFVINVSAPVEDRRYRYEQKMGELNDWVFKNEMSNIGKNIKADHVIHNHGQGQDVYKHILDIDYKISQEYYLRKNTRINEMIRFENEGDWADVKSITT